MITIRDVIREREPYSVRLTETVLEEINEQGDELKLLHEYISH
jgi:hypothetical protein